MTFNVLKNVQWVQTIIVTRKTKMIILAISYWPDRDDYECEIQDHQR